jgi:hypothetical protein
LDDAIATLRATATVRERSRNIAQAVSEGRSPHFVIDRGQLAEAAELVEATTRAAYPRLAIPYHSRWRHFETGAVDRKAQLDARLASHGRPSRETLARARIDLTVVSVLLDAGAGTDWFYDEAESGQRFSRSEGLGIASLRAFMAGSFSSDANEPLRVDGRALQRLDEAAVARIFQVSDANPLVGLAGRTQLLNRLGDVLLRTRSLFGPDGRPGHLFDALTVHGQRHHLPATEVLGALLQGLGGVWITGQSLGGIPLADVWQHPHAGGAGASAGWVPFHKLSQWLTYSLLEPFEWAEVDLTDLDGLTGLPEYRNGGLLMDTGVIQLRDAGYATRPFGVGDEAVVEWRALTVALLDELAPLVRQRLGVTAEQMPLARILEGGTWAAGRAIAKTRRGGPPPMNITSDGTVF